MFFKKKDTIPEENVAKQSIKKMDHVVTGLLLGGVIASIYGVKKLHNKGNHDVHEGGTQDENHAHEEHGNHQSDKKKQGIVSRLFFGNK
ncbi:MAG: hypothetical protein HHAS10_09880 [Candidatus Altimarinota bacterium]